MNKKPSVIVNCVANHYALPGERIVEFCHQNKEGKSVGGLMSLRESEEGKLIIHLYRMDRDVEVYIAEGEE